MPEEITEEENVDIRLTLTRKENFHDVKYYIKYIQMMGKREVMDNKGNLLENRQFNTLNDIAGIDRSDPLRQEFTLWFHNLSDKNVEIQFIVQDNFGQHAELTVSFAIR